MAYPTMSYRFKDPQPKTLQQIAMEEIERAKTDDRLEAKRKKRSEISKAYWAKKKGETK